MKCRSCGMEVPEQGDTCPYCKKPKWTDNRTELAIGSMGLLGCAVGYLLGSSLMESTVSGVMWAASLGGLLAGLAGVVVKAFNLRRMRGDCSGVRHDSAVEASERAASVPPPLRDR